MPEVTAALGGTDPEHFLPHRKALLDSINLHKRESSFLSFNFAGKIIRSIAHSQRNRIEKKKEKMALLTREILYLQKPLGTIESLDKGVNSLQWTNLTMLKRREI